MAGEVAAVAALAAFAFYYPFVFAGVTAAAELPARPAAGGGAPALRAAVLLRRPRQARDVPDGARRLLRGAVQGRCWPASPRCSPSPAPTPTGCSGWRSLFGVCVYAGASRAAAAVDPRRSAADALGLLPPGAAAGAAVLGRARAAQPSWPILPPTNVTDIGWKIIFDTPPHPSIEQVSELFFQLKQAFDDFIVTALERAAGRASGRASSASSSASTCCRGSSARVYAALIAGGVRRAEDALL